jgi:small subunit ribosomal protein S6
MRKYETVMVLNPNLGEAQVKDEAAKVQKLLETNGAQEISNSIWGKKEIAYPMKKNKFGTFISFNYRAPSEGCVDTLTNVLRISDPVLKFQTHKINERVRKFRGNPKRKAPAGGDEFSDSADSEF